MSRLAGYLRGYLLGMGLQTALEESLAPPRHSSSLLSLDPSFGNELAPDLWRSLRETPLVAVECYKRGAWQPPAASASRLLALLVIDGLLIREVQVAGRTSAELFGAGDIIQPPDPQEAAISPPATWTALTAGRIAFIDERLLAVSPGSLALLSAVASRCTQRWRTLNALALTRTMRRTDARLLFLLAFLAARWGRMRADGVRLALPVRHETLARLIGTRRQSVTTSLGQLRQRGLLEVLPNGDWLLTSPIAPPENMPITPLATLVGDETVSLLDVDPQLAARIPAEQLAVARLHAHAPVRTLARGAWDASGEYEEPGGLGLLITRGFVARRSVYDGEATMEILGPGDLLRPWDDAEEWLPRIETSWQALVPSELALLDESFARRMAPWPSLATEILARASRRARWLAASLAVSQQTHTATRVVSLLSRLARRWGTGPDRLIVPLPLTHAQIGELIGAQRPSVTVAIGGLCRQRALERLADGTWRISRWHTAHQPKPPRSLRATTSPSQPRSGCPSLRASSTQLQRVTR